MTTLYTHPEYQQRYENWVLAKDLYEGKHSVITSKYLIPHTIEESNDNTAKRLRALRVARTRYKNLTEIGVSIWQSLFFREPPKPDDKLQKLLDNTGGEENIDGLGTNLTSFIKNKVLPSRLNYGKVCILCDSYPVEAATLAQQKANKIRPYMDLIDPLDAVDWVIEYATPERIGKYNSFRYVFYGMAPRANSSVEPILRKYTKELRVEGGVYVAYQYYVDVDSSFKVINDHWDLEKKSEDWQGNGNRQTTTLKEIPISIIDSESWFKDANEESLRFFNIRSNKDNILHQQGYQDKYIVGVSPDDTARIKAFNEYSYKLLPENGNAFAIEPVDTAAYERAEAEAQASFFNVALNKLRLMPNDSKETQAADATDKENEFTYSIVESELEELEGLLNDSFKNYALLMGDENFDGHLELNKQITPESFQQFLNMHGALRDILSKVEGYDQAAAEKAIKKARFTTEQEEKLLKVIKETDLTKGEAQLVKGKLVERDPIDDILGGESPPSGSALDRAEIQRLGSDIEAQLIKIGEGIASEIKSELQEIEGAKPEEAPKAQQPIIVNNYIVDSQKKIDLVRDKDGLLLGGVSTPINDDNKNKK